MIAQEIKNSTDGYATDIKTLRKDTDDLGDQVQNIEAKIPQSASTSNKLVDNATMTNYVDNAVAGSGVGTGGGSGLTGVVVLTKTDLTKSARSDSQRINIGTRAYKFITLELNSADGYCCSPMHSSAGYGNRSGNFATIKVELSAAEFTDNLIIKNGGDTFGYKVTLWY